MSGPEIVLMMLVIRLIVPISILLGLGEMTARLQARQRTARS